MNITKSSKATTAAPAVDQPIAESAEYVGDVGGKSTVEDSSKQADKVCIFFFIICLTINLVYSYPLLYIHVHYK